LVNGEVLAGRYRLLGLLGRGGVGEVWRAEDLQLGRPVAIKLLRRLEGDALSSLERFKREAQATARLSHPNVVATYDIGSTDDRAYLVMELVRGGDLAQLLRNHGLPPAEEVADLAIQAARGLDAAHAAGIVHRDVKPANLLLSSDGTLKITDFGIARMLGTENTGGLTGPVLLGTAAYLSPEQVRGEPATPASDRYALGCVLYELLAGRTPFTGEAHEVLDGHVRSEPVPVLAYRPDAGAGLANLVMHLLAKDPAVRPATAAEAEACLGATGAAEPPPTEVLTLPELVPAEEFAPERSSLSPNARRAAIIAVVAAAALAVGLGVAKLASDDATPLADANPPSVQPTATTKPKPTATPVHKTTPTPTPTPSASPTSQADQLRALAELLRNEDAHGRTAKMLREAAKDLDEAAARLAGGDSDAARKVRDAFRRLNEAQRDGRWQPSPQVVAQFRQLGPLPNTSGDGQQD
jgi:serine/threonine-protein kinase